ncbi:MAG: MBL fold metallo-hydrolase [Bdellovibrionota bacterium]
MSALSFTFIANACGIFKGSKGTRLLCDPWIVDGVFEGSWCHFPKLETTFSNISDVDAIFISHLHPDHLDDRHFDFRKDVPIIVLDHGPNFLAKKLLSMGFLNLIRVKDQETVQFKEFEITLFAPFTKHNYHDSVIGNLIDSAMVISCEGFNALNANDNTPTPEVCSQLRDRFGKIDLAMINYNAAGPYPSCFNNLSIQEKKKEHSRILERNLQYLSSLIFELNPRFVLPFAGAYVLGGRMSFKNEYLGTMNWDECAKYLLNTIKPEVKVVLLREKMSFDIENGVSDKTYIPLDPLEMQIYISEFLSKLKYTYEEDDYPDIGIMLQEMEIASSKMTSKMKSLGIESQFDVIIKVNEENVQIFPGFKLLSSPSQSSKTLTCSLDVRLMKRILHRRANWNSAEIGTHIDFIRIPNIYEPDLHTALQFFHI